MNNNDIAEHFSMLSRLMDLHGENSFKSKTYSIAAYTIERLPMEIETMADAELFGIRGIGDATGKKIKDLLATGKLPALEKIIADTPPGVLEILQIKGLGPKKTAVIWKELAIESVGELEYACNENRLASMKGFGAKTQEAVLKSIEFMRSNQGLYLWAEAYTFSNALINGIKAKYPVALLSATGNLRRQYEIVEYVDIVANVPQADLVSLFNAEVADIKIIDENIVIVSLPNQPRIRFHSCETNEFYKNLFTTTGSDDFINGFLAQYTVPAFPKSEESIFGSNSLQYIPPAQRESAAILIKSKSNNLPILIQPVDIKGIIHSHSKWSDGNNTLEEMAVAAKKMGLEYLVISDHSQSAYYANGLTPERIAAQHIEIDALNVKLAPFRIFKSVESDILNDGSLDYSPEVLSKFDLVIASVHSNLKMSQDKAMERVLTAIRNPYTTILGHPTGRLLLSRPGYPLDFKKIIDECVIYKVVIEINAHPHRLDLDWRWIEYALEQGVLLAIDPDAHSIAGYDDVFYGVMAAQKGGLTVQQNLSSFNLRKLEEFIEKRKKNI